MLPTHVQYTLEPNHGHARMFSVLVWVVCTQRLIRVLYHTSTSFPSSHIVDTGQSYKPAPLWRRLSRPHHSRLLAYGDHWSSSGLLWAQYCRWWHWTSGSPPDYPFVTECENSACSDQHVLCLYIWSLPRLPFVRTLIQRVIDIQIDIR